MQPTLSDKYIIESPRIAWQWRLLLQFRLAPSRYQLDYGRMDDVEHAMVVNLSILFCAKFAVVCSLIDNGNGLIIKCSKLQAKQRAIRWFLCAFFIASFSRCAIRYEATRGQEQYLWTLGTPIMPAGMSAFAQLMEEVSRSYFWIHMQMTCGKMYRKQICPDVGVYDTAHRSRNRWNTYWRRPWFMGAHIARSFDWHPFRFCWAVERLVFLYPTSRGLGILEGTG